MTCRELIDFLMDYHSGTLPAAEKAAFDHHLALCPPCVDYLRTYEETVKLGKGACAEPDGEVPDEVPEELVRAILAARGKQ
jgi:anti-sigma factor RsiW